MEKSEYAAKPDIAANRITPGIIMPMIAKDSMKAAEQSPKAIHSGFCCSHKVMTLISNTL
tara:strand:- start:281 stop:460 length:180 start_codon:yes stop_codon:yes gene_type:complete